MHHADAAASTQAAKKVTMRVLTDEQSYLTVQTPLDADKRKFVLSELFGDERLSGLFHYRLKLRTSDNAVDFGEILGQPVTVTIEQRNGTKRYIHGVVTGFTQSDSDGNVATYYAEIRPWLWQLSLTTDSKIFQNQNAIEIITAVFEELGFRDFKDNTKGAFDPRDYCVQYQETALDFVSRLMEDEGIFYFFEHTADKHTLVMANEPGSHAVCPGLAKARYLETDPIIDTDDIIEKVTLEEQIISNKYAAEDYNFKTPGTDLLTTVDGKASTSIKGEAKRDLRVYAYPGDFTQTADGEKIINRRIEAIEAPYRVLTGEGNCRAFIAGYKFKIVNHDRADVNAMYILTRVSIRATQQRFNNSFKSIPDDVPFRPPLQTPRPKIFGTQTAVVVGKQGEEIWPDEYGRVKVQFHWDQLGQRDEKSSCWIRVAQIWAGKNWGTFFTPRMGTEVIVSFLEGNPDRPLIIGTVYNDTQAVPYPMPAQKNISTIQTISTLEGEAGNEIRFDDTKDEEELYFHAQKDHNIKVENNRQKEVLNEETNTITQHRTTTITEGNDTYTVAKGNRAFEVSKGNETYAVKGTRELTITGAETHINKDAFTHTVTKNYTLTVDGNLSIKVKGTIDIVAQKNLTIKTDKALLSKAGKSLTNKAGAEMLNQAAKDLTNKAGTALTNKAGTDLTNQAGKNLTNKGTILSSKGSASAEVDGGGQLTLKGGMVSIQ